MHSECHLGVIAFAIGKIALTLFHAITSPIAHAMIPKSHSNLRDYPCEL